MVVKRRIYLNMKSLGEARSLWLERFRNHPVLEAVSVPVPDALGRVTAEPVFARLSSPTFHAAAMDGIAVRSDGTYGAGDRSPRRLVIGEEAFWVNTGHPLPEGCDAVIMVEHLHEVEADVVEIRASAYPWQNVRKVGEDIVASELLFPRRHRVRAFDLGALIAAGIHEVRVFEIPRVAVIPTGDELVDPTTVCLDETPSHGWTPDSNSAVLCGMVRECGGTPLIRPIVGDDPEELKSAVRSALDAGVHLVIVNAGSSAGSEDYTYQVLDALGEVLVHGVAMMPGKPTILADVRGIPVVGNPGYPVSAALSFDQFVRPLLTVMQGRRESFRPRIPVRISRAIPSKLGVEEFLRVRLGRVGGRVVATPLSRGAGLITTLTRAEGMIRISELSQGVDAESDVEAELLVDPEELDRTLVFIGSHDLSVDVLADLLRGYPRGYRLSSANVGSLGGLLALRNRFAHAAGCHLLDTETGQYNLSYVRKYLKGFKASLFHLVDREQGFIVARGNPKGVCGVGDLLREDVRFVNRQAGSGTRILLDYRLAQEGIDPRKICGYDHEEYTHMAVAVDVRSGAADVGLGILAAAMALGLDFVPLVREQYDLVIPTEYVEEERIQSLLMVAGSDPFRERVRAMGGYHPEKSGRLWLEVE